MEGGPPLISAENSLLAQPVGPATLLFSWSPPPFFFFGILSVPRNWHHGPILICVGSKHPRKPAWGRAGEGLEEIRDIVDDKGAA